MVERWKFLELRVTTDESCRLRLTHSCDTDPVVEKDKGPVVFLGNDQLASVVADALSIHLEQ